MRWLGFGSGLCRRVSKFICNRKKDDWGGGKAGQPICLNCNVKSIVFFFSFCDVHHFSLYQASHGRAGEFH